MIESLHIKNFLAFPELEVPELKLINLVAGKNNAGKTVLLDALRIYRNPKKAYVYAKVMQERGNPLTLTHKNKDGKYLPGIEINDLSIGFSINGETPSFHKGRKPISPNGPDELLFLDHAEYVSAAVDSFSWISKRWNTFVLTEKEEYVLGILNNVLGLSISRLAVTDNLIKVKIEGEKEPVNIRSLGDGMMRTLQIAIAIVQARPFTDNMGSLLLIDEIETHLHHTVIRKLWKIIFEYATKWNIQIVATTHSQDAIREFWYEAAEKEEYKSNSQVLRLQKDRDGKHEVIQFPFERLDTVLEMEMEIR